MRVTLLEFFGLNTALNNIALAQRKSSRSSVINTIPLKGKEKINIIEYGSSISVFPKDIEVLKKLLEKGKEKAKPIKALNVSLRINASRGWWKAILKFQGVRALFSDSSLLITEASSKLPSTSIKAVSAGVPNFISTCLSYLLLEKKSLL